MKYSPLIYTRNVKTLENVRVRGQTEIYTEYMYSGRSKLSFTVPLIAEPSMNVGTFLERDSLAVKVSIAHGLPLLSIV